MGALLEEKLVASIATSFNGGVESEVESAANDEPSYYTFDDDFQMKIATLAVRDQVFARKTQGLVSPNYFENSAVATLVNLAQEHWLRYKETPSKSAYAQIIKDAVISGRIRRDLLSDVKLTFNEMMTTDLSDRDYVADKVAEFARHKAIELAMMKSLDLMDKNQYDQIAEMIKKASSVGVSQADTAYDYFAEIESRSLERKDIAAGIKAPQGITTGIQKIDKLLYHSGWGRGELSILMGGAKCVVRDTLLFTEDGMIEIGDYVSSSIPVDSFEPLEIDILGRGGIEKTSHVYNGGNQKTRLVTTRRGFEIEGTYDHPMLVIDVSGESVWKNIDDLSVGDFMVIQRGANIFGSTTDLTYAVKAANLVFDNSKRQLCMKVPTLPDVMTPELAEFIGMIVSEGYSGKGGVLSFTQKDDFIFARYVELVNTLFGLDSSIGVKTDNLAKDARVQNIMLEAYLRALGVNWGRSSEKVIPLSIRVSPRECFLAFISPMIGLDGHVARTSSGKVTFEFMTASKQMAKQMQVALLNIGIVSRRKLKRAMATNGHRIMRDYWRLSISGGENMTALRALGVYEDRKNCTLDGVSKPSTERNWIPHARIKIGEIMREVQLAGYSLKSTFSQSDYRSLRTFRGGRQGGVRHLTYSFATKLVAKLDELKIAGNGSNWLRDTVSASYAYDEVVSIEDSENEVVDLTVPNTHSFFANGLVSHNCGKSTGLLFFAKNAALAGHNTLYVTLEMSANIASSRIDACISETEMKELGSNIALVEEAVIEASKGAGALFMAQMPGYSLTPTGLRRLIDSYKTEGTVFDLVVVDYLDLMAPDFRSNDGIENSKNIYVGVRAIGQEENIAILSATQTNREGFKSVTAKAEHAADDFNKIRIADVTISINATDDERARNEARLFFAASRNEASGITVQVKNDIERMVFIKTVLGII